MVVKRKRGAMIPLNWKRKGGLWKINAQFLSNVRSHLFSTVCVK